MRRRGEIAEALSLAASMGPATVRQLAERAQVGYGAARYTESRMVARGELVRLRAGKPTVVALPEPTEEAPLQRRAARGGGGTVDVLRSFWDVATSPSQG